MLDPKRERIQADLRGLLKGEVQCSTVFTQAYATDASVFEVEPVGVVFPKTTLDVVTTVRYARKNGLSVHPRGAGSGCAGGALGGGLILDMSRHMRRILDHDETTIQVQSGLQCARLNDILRPAGQTVRPDRGNSRAATVGGLIAIDGFGSHWLSSGRMSDWLLGLEMVTANGNIVSLGCSEKIPERVPERSEFELYPTPQDEKNRILSAVSAVLRRDQSTSQPHAPRRVIDNMGYNTNIFRENGSALDMARLIAGSEGTLGVITALKLRLQRIPACRKSLMFLFESMENAMKAVPYILKFHPDACDLIDRRYLHLAAERDVRFDAMFPSKTEAALLLDFSDQTTFDLQNQLRGVTEMLIRQRELAFQMVPAWDDTESEFFWGLANTLHPPDQKAHGSSNRITFVEDVAVPPQRMYEFFLKVQELLRSHHLTVAFYAHVGQGQVRLQPLVNLGSEPETARLLRFAHDYYTLVLKFGGSLGTENGIGLGRSLWLPAFLSRKYAVCREIKKIFDSESLFQPEKLGEDETLLRAKSAADIIGKIRTSFIKDGDIQSPFELDHRMVSAEPLKEKEVAKSDNVLDASETSAAPPTSEDSFSAESGMLVLEQVRQILGDVFSENTSDIPNEKLEQLLSLEHRAEETPLQPVTQLGLHWNSAHIREMSQSCNGCADCRGTQSQQRTCPIFHLTNSEFSTPRAKVNLMSAVSRGQLDLSEVGDAAFHEVFHQCFQCHSCRLDCPAEVDVPFLVRKAEEAWVRAKGLDFYDTSMSQMDQWMSRIQRFPRLGRFCFTNRAVRWLMQRFFGVAQERELPLIENRSFLDSLKRSGKNAEFETWTENPFFAETPPFYPKPEIQGRVVYFLDTFANHFDTQLAEATVRVFRHNNIPIVVPRSQQGSGLASVLLGRSDYARKQIFRNAALLADYVRQGFDVVLTEPATTLAFCLEYPQSFPQNEDIALIAKHCYDAGEYLYKLHLAQYLKIPRTPMKLRLGYHAPCRLKALNVGMPALNLLRLIPELEIIQAPDSCCGMGGSYGMMASNYSSSLKIGRFLHAWLRDPTLFASLTECSACRLQMLHNAVKPVLHPMKILAYNYQLLPELEPIFKTVW